MVECQQAGCLRPATKKWQGTMLCQDCYEKQREKYDRLLQEIQDIA